ncbi:MAG: glycosyltransferase family 39 protein [Candidatus Eremiobacteraeota bacterium]|nr:glycosyltransferase family 39 protein [Candidatus Eremiobacteraeota bacterium]
MLGGVLLLGLILRLRGIHNPLLDHPGWRQGDTAAIARNFATLDFNPFHPQVDYNGPPPNFVELELQIVPFLAAVLYKIFGIREIFGRLLSIGFSLANIGILAYFARRLFRSETAGLAAALMFAVYPGSVYYGRTFTPDTAMVCLFTAALYAAYRWIEDDVPAPPRGFWLAAILTAFAIAAKPVAAIVLIPILAIRFSRFGLRGTLASPATWDFLAVALVPYLAYDAYVRSIAEWRWASGITSKHVLPELFASFGSFGALSAKFAHLGDVLFMLRETMLGFPGFFILLLGLALAADNRSNRTLVGAYLVALLAYTYVVVTVERVDYYLYLWLPLGALVTGGLVGHIKAWLNLNMVWNQGALAMGGVLLAVVAMLGRAEVHEYYRYRPEVYRSAKALDATLAPGALVVMAHYDPSVLYYIGRKGWEEDPLLWTPFDEQSAIRKGSRYFISIEDRRMHRNPDLCHWLQRFPLVKTGSSWPVYLTEPTKTAPDAELRWQSYRKGATTTKDNACTAK